MRKGKVRVIASVVIFVLAVALIVTGVMGMNKRTAESGMQYLSDMRTRAVLIATGEGAVESYVEIAKADAMAAAKAAGGGMDLDGEAWHVFGMLWDEKEGYTFYVDGKEDGHIPGPISRIPQFILISTEVQGYRSKALAATDEARAAVGDEFIVDYVRVFDRV